MLKVEFIGADGEPESGIDGGGLFKEFVLAMGRQAFSPEFGTFRDLSGGTFFSLERDDSLALISKQLALFRKISTIFFTRYGL